MLINIRQLRVTWIFLFLLFQLTSSKAQWIQAESKINSNIATVWNNGSLLFAGTTTGIYISSNNGLNWVQSNKGLIDGVSVYCFAQKGINIFAGSSDGLFRSSDNGKTWKDVSGSISIRLIQAILINGEQIFAGTRDGGLWLSTNDGDTWNEYDYGLVNGAIESLCKIDNTLIAGTEWSGVYISTNNGAVWWQSNSGLPEKSVVHSLYIYKQNVYAGIINKGVYRSTDKGNLWKLLTEGLPTNVHSSSFTSSGEYLFAATPNGVYISPNKGDSWKSSNNGLPANVGVSSLEISGNYIFAAVDIGVIYKRLLSEVLTDVATEKILPDDFMLWQNYPNPFNPLTVINYQIPVEEHVLLKVYDILGREVATLVNEIKQTGKYSCSFSNPPSLIASSIYVYTIKAGSFYQSKKMILIK